MKKAWRMATTIRCKDDRGDISKAIEGMGERSRSRVRVSNGVAKCRLVYVGNSSAELGKSTPCNIPSPSNLV